ncbi:MAG: hypothetical protein ACKPKO_44295, partial [Candidatus Fonsibacter sp.]
MLEATARLSLDTARAVRRLQSVVTRTIVIADNTPGGPAIRRLCAVDFGSDVECLPRCWAQLILALLACPVGDSSIIKMAADVTLQPIV